MAKSRKDPESPADENPSDRGDATKPAATILKQEISIGTEQLGRSTRGLLLSSISAGLDIGFGPMMAATVFALGGADDLATRFAMAVASSVGFVIVILGRSELFTEHTTLAVLPLLSGRTSVSRVARLWGLVYVGNLAGVALFAVFAVRVGVGLHLFGPEELGLGASRLTDHGGWMIFGSALAAGWLMGLVSWLVTAGRDTVGQICIIVLLTGAIAFLHLHHCIAGSIEVLMGVVAGQLPFGAYLRFLVIATAGNVVGGVVMVGALKFGHVTQGAPVAAPRRR